MPRQYQMTWNARSGRWFKKYQGRQYAVSCKELSCPATKQDSYQQANEWWQQKRGEIDRAEIDSVPAAQANFYSQADLERKPRGQVALANGNPTGNPTGITVAELASVETARGTRSCGTLTVAAQVEAWKQMKLDEVATGEISVGRYDSYRLHIEAFREWLGGHNSIEIIDAPKMAEYLSHIKQLVGQRHQLGKGHGISEWYGKQRVETAVQFCKYLWELGLIELPRNIQGKKFKITVDQNKIVPTISIDLAKKILAGNEKTSEVTRLYLLLMLNCGMQQSDIGSLTQDSVDWKAGTLTYRRGKTKKHKNPPTVTYPLWAETLRLLKKYRSAHEQWLLVNENGNQVWRQWLNDRGTRSVVDNIKTAYKQRYIDHFPENERPSLKLLRKTGCDTLENHTEYKYYTDRYLANVPTGVAGKHYKNPSQEEFAEAVKWLGEQFGYETE